MVKWIQGLLFDLAPFCRHAWGPWAACREQGEVWEERRCVRCGAVEQRAAQDARAARREAA